MANEINKSTKSNTINIFLSMTPPSGTAQQRKISFKRCRTYLPKRVRAARDIFETALLPFRLGTSLTGPLEVTQKWYYPLPESRRRKGVTILPKTTTGDADNIAKLLNDACTRVGIWQDDRLIYKLCIEKYSIDPKIHPVGREIIIESPSINKERFA